MSQSVANINAILNPVLFQVLGSTPESLRDSLLKANIKNNPNAGIQLLSTAIFASAVNKTTLETFLSGDNVKESRTIIMNSLSINNKANMTGITLLGHCLLTTSFVDDIQFAQEFRRKMGQKHIWDGDLSSGNLSEMQSKILKEKKKSASSDTAKLLGSAFIKWTGISTERMTNDELAFWGNKAEPSTSAQVAGPASEVPRVSTSVPSPPLQPAAQPVHRRAQASVSTPPRRVATETVAITKSNSEVQNVQIPSDILRYYRTVQSDNPADLAASIGRHGTDGFIARYGEALRLDPEMRGAGNSSVVG